MKRNERIRKYIAFRYKNWQDYAIYQSTLHGFEGWGEDLLNDIIVNLLEKPDIKIIGMINRKTRKIVNGQPTTELDKFVLRMLKLNAWSQVAPFRKNTLGLKIISRKDGIQTVQKEQAETHKIECEEQPYDEEVEVDIDHMHHQNIKRLKKNGFGQEAIQHYQAHFIEQKSLDDFRASERAKVERIKYFLIEQPKTILEL